MKKINLPPNPSSLIASMREIGYSIETAIADVIDNSITAVAKRIDVCFSWNSGNPWLAIIDDGLGMNKDELIAAMRFGSMSPLEDRSVDDLGRFGLGLKTASFSQCRCLIVVSKKSEITNSVQWDLDFISSSNDNQWPLCLPSEDEIENDSDLSSLKETYLDSKTSGTIVLWKNIDRIDEGTSKKSREARFDETINNVRSHLELVFHRFLSPDHGKSKVEIFLNKNLIEAFDPFNTSKATELHAEEFRYAGECIHVQPYVLPHHNKVSKSEWNKYAGKHGYLHEQGFYVYRNRRLIISAIWFRLIPKEELTKLLRVKIDIPNTLDHLWRIDVKKSNAFPPAGVRDELKRIIGKIELSGKSVYRQRGQRLASEIKIPAWERIAKENQIYYQINKNHPLLKQHKDNLSVLQEELFTNIIAMLESTFPRESFYNDVATNPEQVAESTLEKEQIEGLLKLFLGENEQNISKSKLREILQIDPFASNKQLTENIFRERGFEL